jgi:DNA-directed RNA polymerase beta subunit
MEAVVARDSGAAIMARRAGVVDQVDAQRIVVRATEMMSNPASRAWTSTACASSSAPTRTPASTSARW